MRGVLSREPRFVSVDEALTLHETAIDEYGGSPGVRDIGLLESALAMPRQGFGGEFVHEFPFAMAAAYLFHICQNHPFVDGNKRAAFATCVVFLRFNGWNLTAPQDAALEFVYPRLCTVAGERNAMRIASPSFPCQALKPAVSTWPSRSVSRARCASTLQNLQLLHPRGKAVDKRSGR